MLTPAANVFFLQHRDFKGLCFGMSLGSQRLSFLGDLSASQFGGWTCGT